MDKIGAIFSALADPTRRAMLGRLADRSLNVGDLTRMFKISQPAISKHLKVLETAGLISRQQIKQQRLCRVEPEMLALATAWMADISKTAQAQKDTLKEAAPSEKTQLEISDQAQASRSKEPQPAKPKENWSIAPLWSRE